MNWLYFVLSGIVLLMIIFKFIFWWMRYKSFYSPHNCDDCDDCHGCDGADCSCNDDCDKCVDTNCEWNPSYGCGCKDCQESNCNGCLFNIMEDEEE